MISLFSAASRDIWRLWTMQQIYLWRRSTSKSRAKTSTSTYILWYKLWPWTSLGSQGLGKSHHSRRLFVQLEHRHLLRSTLNASWQSFEFAQITGNIQTTEYESGNCLWVVLIKSYSYACLQYPNLSPCSSIELQQSNPFDSASCGTSDTACHTDDCFRSFISKWNIAAT